MKKKRLVYYSIFCIIAILLILVFYKRNISKIEYYEYPKREEWSIIGSKERVEALIIPKKIVKRMTDKSLIQAIADYPLLSDLYVYGTVQDGLKVFQKQCSAYQELISRSTAKDCFLTDGIALIKEFREDSQNDRNQLAAMVLSDMIRELYSDVNIDEYLK